MNDQRIQKAKALLKKYSLGTCTPEELSWITAWYLEQHSADAAIAEQEELALDLLELQERIADIHRIPKISKWRSFRVVVAAASIMLVLAGMWVWKVRTDRNIDNRMADAEHILPGIDRATLLLDDDEKIKLSDEHTGIEYKDHTIRYADGKEVYVSNKPKNATLRTENGAQYQALLPDGTKVWLNAASSVSFPTEFEKYERRVKVTGEVYMEVKKDPLRPFVVTTAKQQIEVLGTSFNLDTYGDNGSYVTTLTEGSLKVNSRGGKSAMLKPGQQAVLNKNAELRIVNVDIAPFIAWKDGVYVVQNQKLAQFGKQIARWYNVDVDMGEVGDKRISIIIRRDVRLSELLAAIELNTDVKFSVKERRVSVISIR